MPVVASWDWGARRIYLGVADYDPIDIYREHRSERLANEAARSFPPMVRAIGGQSKGGGRRFGNALQLVSGASFSAIPDLEMALIVPLDGSGVNTLAGEVVTDNPDVISDPFDSSGLSNPPRIVTSPVSNITQVSTGSGLSAEQANQLLRLYQRQGLDASSEVTITPTDISFAGVTVEIEGDGTSEARLRRTQ